MPIKRAVWVFMMVVLLAGCGATTKVAVKPAFTKSINTIAIIRPDEPASYRYFNLGSPAAAFGAVGGAIIGADAESGEKYLREVMAKNNFRFSEQLVTDLEAQLKMSGYKVVIIEASREEKGELLKNYAVLDMEGADAVLDLAVTNAGWVTEHFMFSPFWRPEARMHVALYSKKTDQTGYADTLMYGFHNPLLSGTDLDAPEAYRYDKAEDLQKAGDKTLIDGLKEASKSIAIHIATQLQR